ncbi:MAG: AIR carboxylase family protein, partial [Thermoanaerobaculia bacterium]
APVIACPPYSEKFSGADIFSSLNMPSYVSPMVVLDPENAALAAIKILGMEDEKLREKLASFKNEKMMQLQEEDEKIRRE